MVLLVMAALAAAVSSTQAMHVHPGIGQTRLLERMETGESPLLVDVRTPQEFRGGHLPGAINIPLQDFARRYGELAEYQGRELVLYCETGARASYAGRYLNSRGFTELRFLEGHMGAWRKAGMPQEP
jgi:rhodanese-related sulfurtransferase